MCLRVAYLNHEFGYQYVDIFHNNEVQISSVVTHVGTVGRRTLYTYLCQMMFGTYKDHAASRKYYMFQNVTSHFIVPYVLYIMYLVF